MKKISIVVLIVAILALATYFFMQEENVPTSQGSLATSGLECHDSPNYFMIQKSLADAVGSNIVIKYKTDPGQNFPCEYTVANGDYEIRNVIAEYFLTFTDNFLEKHHATDRTRYLFSDLVSDTKPGSAVIGLPCTRTLRDPFFHA